MFLDEKTVLEIWLNPGLNLTIFRGTGPRTLLIRFRKLRESGSILIGHYTGQTELKLDSLSFLTLINKFQSHSDGVLGVFVFKTPC